jgi:cytochrome c oxidase subunit 2
LCGANHGFMPIAVEAVPPAEFAAWIKAKGGTMPANPNAPSTALIPQPGADTSDATATPAPNLPPAEPGTAAGPVQTRPATAIAPVGDKSDI